MRDTSPGEVPLCFEAAETCTPRSLHPASTATYMSQGSNMPFQLKYDRHSHNTPIDNPEKAATSTRQLQKDDDTPIDTPEKADTSTHQLQEGDVVIFATDGVWDNIYLKGEILPDVSAKMLKTRCWKKKKDGVIAVSSEHLAAATRDPSGAIHTTLARAVVAMAKTASMDPTKAPPVFELLFGQPHIGGKEDDITVVVTVVTKDSPNPSVPKPAAHL